jgi:hypothetical protein
VDGSAVMQFSHFSVKEYLTSTRIAEGRALRYYIPLEPAHTLVTRACLSFLLQLDEHLTEECIEESPLAGYAGRYWAGHAEFGNVSLHTEDMIKRIFNPEDRHFANWVWIYDTISDRSMISDRFTLGPSCPKWAPLHYAAQHGFHRVAEWLITTCSQGVNVFHNGCTPAHIASRRGQVTALQTLLTHHADVNAGYRTLLHFASRDGHPKAVQLLLEHGADVNFKTGRGETPLRLLSEGSGNLEVAQVLLEHGANPSVRSISGWDSLYMALRRDNQDLVQLLLKHGADPDSRDVDGQTLLHIASRLGDLEVAQRLLNLDVDVNSRDSYGNTPVQVALEGYQQEGNKILKERVVQLLLRHGAKRE